MLASAMSMFCLRIQIVLVAEGIESWAELDTLKTACQPADVLTPIARLDAIARRLEAMLQAVKSVRSALEDFYTTLSDEQKAQFEAIGPRRTS